MLRVSIACAILAVVCLVQCFQIWQLQKRMNYVEDRNDWFTELSDKVDEISRGLYEP